MKVNEITEAVIGAAIEVHRALGPGLLHSAYIQCLCYELTLRKIPFELEVLLPVVYKGFKLDCGYRVDMVVVSTVVVEVKAVEHIVPVHEAQQMMSGFDTVYRAWSRRILSLEHIGPGDGHVI